MPPSSAVVPRDVFTTTIYADGTPAAAVPRTGTHAPLPVAAIAGGLASGVVLGLLIVGGWFWWCRSPEKQGRNERSQLRSAMKPPNASKQSLPRPNANMAVAAGNGSQKSVTFAPSPRTSDESVNQEKGKQTPRVSPDMGSRTSLERTPMQGSRTSPQDSRTSLDRMQASSSRTSLDHAQVSRTSLDRAAAAQPSPDTTSSGSRTPDSPRPPARNALRPTPAQQLPHTHVPSRPSPLAHTLRAPVPARARARAPGPRQPAQPAPLPPGASQPVPPPAMVPIPPVRPPRAVLRTQRSPPPVRYSTTGTDQSSSVVSAPSQYSQSTASEGAEILLRTGLRRLYPSQQQ